MKFLLLCVFLSSPFLDVSCLDSASSNEQLGQQAYIYPQIKVQPAHQDLNLMTKIYDSDQTGEKRFKIQNKSAISSAYSPGADEYDDFDAEEDAALLLDNSLSSKAEQANLLKDTGMLEGFSTEKAPLSASDEIKDEALHEQRSSIFNPSDEVSSEYFPSSSDTEPIRSSLSFRSNIREPGVADEDTFSKDDESVNDEDSTFAPKPSNLNDSSNVENDINSNEKDNIDPSSKRESIENFAEEDDQMLKDVSNVDNDEDDLADDSERESSDDSNKGSSREDLEDDSDVNEETASIDDSDDLFDNGVSDDATDASDKVDYQDDEEPEDQDGFDDPVNNNVNEEEGSSNETDSTDEPEDETTDDSPKDESSTSPSETCDEGEKKSAIIEYVSSHQSPEESETEPNESLIDEQSSVKRNNFECAECSAASSPDNDRSKQSPIYGLSDAESDEVGSNDQPDVTYCKDMNTQSRQQGIVSPAEYLDKRSSGLNSVFSRFSNGQPTCPAHCSLGEKRSETNTPMAMEYQWLWKSLNSAIKYHSAGRSSIAILVDGNIQAARAIIRRFALNLMLLFSRDSAVILGHFRSCFGHIQLDKFPMIKPWSDSEYAFSLLLDRKRVQNLGSYGDRKVSWVISSILDSVAQTADTLNTKMKVIFMIINGPTKATDAEIEDLKKVGEQIKLREVQVYIIQIGGNFSSCLWTYLTPPTRIFSVHEAQQLLYGGQVESSSYPNEVHSPDSSSLWSGVTLIIQNRMRAWTKQIAEELRANVIEKHGIVGWSTETSPDADRPTDVFNDRSKIEVLASKRGDISKTGSSLPDDVDENDVDEENVDNPTDEDEDSEKRQTIRGRRSRRRSTGRRRVGTLQASRSRVGRFFGRQRQSSSMHTTSVRSRSRYSISQRGGFSVRARQAGRSNTKVQNSNYMNSLSNMWNWGNVFPDLKSSVINPTDHVFVVDTLDIPDFSVIQKATYNIVKLFASSLSRSTILALRAARLTPICDSRAFSIDEDIMRATSTIPSSRGRAIALSPHLMNLISPSSRFFTTQNQNVLILFLRRPVADFASFRYLSGLFRSRRIAIYVLGPGLINQQAAFVELTTPDRLFLTPNLETFLTRSVFSRLVAQLRRDCGASQPILDITGTKLIRPFRYSTRKVSRARRISSRRRSGRRMSGSRRSNRRITSSQTSQRRRTWPQRLLGRIRSGVRKIARRIRGPSRNRSTKKSIIFKRQSVPRARNSGFSRFRFRSSSRRRTAQSRNSFVSQASVRIAQTPSVQLPVSVVSTGSLSILIDGSFHLDMTRVRNLVRALINSFVREGTYFTISFFGTRIHRVANSEMLLNSPQVDAVVNRIRGIRGGRRLTGQALYDVIRSSGGTVPGSASALIVILAGNSQDDYLAPSIELRKSGIRVITCAGNSRLSNVEANAISTSPQLSFRISLNGINHAINRLVPVLQSIYGIRSGAADEPGRFAVLPSMVSRLWNWKSYRSGILYRSVAPTQLAVLLDMSESPDRVIRMCHNVLRLFSRRSPISMRTIGLSGDARVNGVEFRLYEDPSALQLQLQGLTANTFLSRRARSRYILGRRSRTSTIRRVARRIRRVGRRIGNRIRRVGRRIGRGIGRAMRRVGLRDDIPTEDNIVDDDLNSNHADKRQLTRRRPRFSQRQSNRRPTSRLSSSRLRDSSTYSSKTSRFSRLDDSDSSGASIRYSASVPSSLRSYSSYSGKQKRPRFRELASSEFGNAVGDLSSSLMRGAYNKVTNSKMYNKLISGGSSKVSPYSKYKKLTRQKTISKGSKAGMSSGKQNLYSSGRFYDEGMSKSIAGDSDILMDASAIGTHSLSDGGINMDEFEGSLVSSNLAEDASDDSRVDRHGLLNEGGSFSYYGTGARGSSSRTSQGSQSSRGSQSSGGFRSYRGSRASKSFGGSRSSRDSRSSQSSKGSRSSQSSGGSRMSLHHSLFGTDHLSGALAASSSGGMSVFPSSSRSTSYSGGVSTSSLSASSTSSAHSESSAFSSSSSSYRGEYFGRRYRGMRRFIRYYGFGRSHSDWSTRRWISRYGRRLMSRSWINLSYRMNQVTTHMSSRSYVSISGGANRNQALVVILSGWPYRLRGSKSGDGGFWKAARRLRAAGIRLYIIVMQHKRTRNSVAQPLLRAASTAFLWRSWTQAQRAVSLMRATFSRHLGLSTNSRYPAVFQRDPSFSSSGYTVMPRLRPALPASTETFLNTNYLTSIQNLATMRRWKRIVPGIRYHYIRSNINVVFLVDISRRENFFAVRDLIKNLMRLFSYRYTRFTLVTISTRITNRFINARFKNHFQLSRAINRITAVGPPTTNLGPNVRSNYGQGLRYINSRIIPRLLWRAKTLVVVVATRSSGDAIHVGSLMLQNRGITVSTVGVGNQYNSDELIRAASNPQLHSSGYESMLPLMVYRLEYAYSLVCHGVRNVRRISSRTSTIFQPSDTVFVSRRITGKSSRITLRSRTRLTSRRTAIPSMDTVKANSQLKQSSVSSSPLSVSIPEKSDKNIKKSDIKHVNPVHAA